MAQPEVAVHSDDKGKYLTVTHTKTDGGRCTHTMTSAEGVKFAIDLIQKLKEATAHG